MITLSIIASLLASILIFFIVVFLLVKDWRDQIHRYYAYFTTAAFGILFTMLLTYAIPDMIDLTLVNKITQLSTVLCFSGLFALSLVFPKSEKKFPFIYIVIILIPSYVIGGIAVFTDWNITRAYFKEGLLQRDFQPFYTVYAAITFSYIILAVGNFIRKYFTTPVEIYRLQMRYVFVASSIAIFISGITSIILPRFFNYSDVYVFGPSISAFFAISSLFYSIVSHNMMDITTAAHKTAMYGFISAAIFLPIFGIISIYDAQTLFIGNYISKLPPYMIIISIVFMFLLFSSYLQPVIDGAFKRKQYEFEQILDNFIRESAGIRDFKSIVQRSVDVLVDSLYLKSSFFLMFNNDNRKYELFYARGGEMQVDSLERNAMLIRWFVRNQEVLNLDQVYIDDKNFGDIRDEVVSFFTLNKVKMVLPIYHRRMVLGLLCLGDKDSLAGFKPDEIEKLQHFQSESNIQISNALTYEEAKREQFVSRTIDLSADILSKAIPESLPNMLGIKFGAFLVPKYGEGVDYFDFLRPGSQGVGVVATDVSGIGVNSALYSVVLRSAFQSSIHEAPSSYSVLQRLNSVLYNYSQGKGGFITGYYYYFDLKSMRLIYSNAGFPPMELFRIEKNDFDSLDTEGIPLGYDPSANYGMGRTYLLRGDIGVLYSKALVNSKNQKGEIFPLTELRTIVRDNRTSRPTEIAQVINDRFKAFMGISSPESDIVVIVFKTV